MTEEDVDFEALELYLTGHKLLGTVPVSNNEIRDNLFGLMFASQDSTSTVLGSSGLFPRIRC